MVATPATPTRRTRGQGSLVGASTSTVPASTESSTAWKLPSDVRSVVCAVVVTYCPGAGLEARYCAIAGQVAEVVVVDNGSGPDTVERLRGLGTSSPVHVIANRENLGIGVALNQGFEEARRRGYSWVVAFDQDSEPAPDMILEMVGSLQRCAAPSSVAVVGPNVIEQAIPDTPHRFLRPHGTIPGAFLKSPARDSDLTDASTVITSGSLYNMAAFHELGPFRGDFFMDYVDTEYCLRAHRRGYIVLVSARAALLHNFGNRKSLIVLGLQIRPTFHAPARLYYVYRNRIAMIRMYALAFPHWLAFELLAAILNMFRIVAFEDHRLAKVRASLRGTWDGLLGRMGPGPADLRGE